MQTILFIDIDSTLVENLFSRKAIGTVLSEIERATGKPIRELAHEMGKENSRRQLVDPDNVLTMDWQDIVVQLGKQYGVSVEGSVDALWQQYANAEDVQVLDNAPTVLDQLRAGGRQLVIATKGLMKYQQPVLDVTGLTPFFDDILTPDVTGYLKTSAQYFDKYRSQKACFIQIGDHYYDDVMCAKRNGFYAIMRAPFPELAMYDPFDRPQVLEKVLEKINTFPDDGTDIRPDAVVISLEETPAVVAELEARFARL